MSTKDISRFLDQPQKHYAGVRLQQGRTLLDSDFNEGARLLEGDRRRSLLEILGPSASPDGGFGIGIFGESSAEPLKKGDSVGVQAVVLNGQPVNVHQVRIAPGSIYLGGMRFDLGDMEDIAAQRGFLQMTADDLPGVVALPDPYHRLTDVQYPPFRYLYYLNGWEQAVTSAEDEEFLERGLGGPDTSVRIRRMRRVQVHEITDPTINTCSRAFQDLVSKKLEAGFNAELDPATGELRSRAKLRLEFQQPDTGEDCPPCNPDPGALYVGNENQALRIMLTDPDHFVWAIDNGAPLYRVAVTGLSGSDEVKVRMLTPPADQEHQPRRNRVVEIIPFGALMEGGEGLRTNDPHFQKVADEVGAFVRVAGDYDPSERTFTLEPSASLEEVRALVTSWDEGHPGVQSGQLNFPDPTGSDTRYFYMRVWHQADTPDDILVRRDPPDALPVLGDTGIMVHLNGLGLEGDTWLATLRVDTRGRIVPFDLLSADPFKEGVAPHGPRHFYAPLGLLHGDDFTVVSFTDCRPPVRRITDRGCVTRTVGDGVRSRGDFRSIQAAIDSLPPQGGFIEVRPGLYREEIQIVGRGRIVIRGCGEATVLQTPSGATGAALVRMAFTGHHDAVFEVTLANLALHAAEQRAIQSEGTSFDLAFEGLSLVAGALVGGTFVAGNGSSNVPLIDIADCIGLKLQSIDARPGRRPTLLLEGCTDIEVRSLRASGAGSASAAPAAPMVRISHSATGLLADLRLRTYGQVGVSVFESSDITMRRLNVVTSALNLPGGAQAQALSAVDIDSSVQTTDRILLEESTLIMSADPSEHAVVVLVGSDVVLETNRIETMQRESGDDDDDEFVASAWGGVQVRGGSRRVRIRENHIEGGLGHGITLGSVQWRNTAQVLHREGAGKVQLTGGSQSVVTGDLRGGYSDGSGSFVAVNEGAIEELVISENTIEQMGTCGIAALTVLGLPELGTEDPDLIDVMGLVIERNTIRENLRQIGAESPRSDVLPFTPGRGSTPTAIDLVPFAGISLAVVTESADIRGNVIASNGTSPSLPTNGIFILAGDGIAISENRIFDNGGRANASQHPLPGVRAGIAVMLAGSGVEASTGDIHELLSGSGSDLPTADAALRIFQNTVRHPEGRALHAVAIGPLSVHDNFLSSQGNHGADTVSERALVGDVVLLEDLGAPWEAASFPNSPFTSPPPGAEDYLRGNTTPEFWFLSQGGSLAFQNNQVTFDWEVEELPATGPLSYFPIALLSLDHVAMNGNQCALRLRGSLSLPQFGAPSPLPGNDFIVHTPLFSHVLAAGGTVQVADNRFAEEVSATTFSAATYARMLNVTAYNQATHAIIAHKPLEPTNSEFVFDEGNLIIFAERDLSPPSTLTGFLGTFFDMMRRMFGGNPA
jgi:hypothetical protein